MKKQTVLLVTLMILFAALFIGCGGSGNNSSSSSDGEAVVEVKPREEVVVGDPEAGKTHYQSLCSACHGQDAKGLPNLGKDLTSSEFLKTKTDREFVEFIITGRPSSDPENTTGIDMPPRGGNPALTDEDIADIVAYVRTLEE